jgi:putative redox protein
MRAGKDWAFNGGQLLYLAIGMRLKRPLSRSRRPRHPLDPVRVRVVGEFEGDPAVSQDVSYDVEVAGEASHEQLEELVSHVDAIAEIPNSVRRGTPVKLRHVEIDLPEKDGPFNNAPGSSWLPD